MEFPYITALTAGALLVLQQILMLSVGMYRGKLKLGAGTGGDVEMERKIRRHGNLAESSAIFLVGLGLLEATGAPEIAQWFAVIFVIARVSHALAFTSTKGSHEPGMSLFLVLRAVGAFGTALGGIALGAVLLYRLMSSPMHM